MKFNLFLILFLFLSVSLGAEELDSWSKLIRKGNTYYKKSDNLPFTGVLKNFFPTGEISVIDHFKDGKQHGEFKSFHRNGKISMTGSFDEGKQVGFWFEYYDDGSLYWKLEYKNGKKGLLGLFMGEVMKLSKGKADPKLANKLLILELEK